MDKLDFYQMGYNRAGESEENLEKISQEIEKKYGLNKKIEFEAGVAEAKEEKSEELRDNIMNYLELKMNDELENCIHATTNYGKSNWRNNSYFDGKGSSRQTIVVNKKVQYNEPKVLRKKRIQKGTM